MASSCWRLAASAWQIELIEKPEGSKIPSGMNALTLSTRFTTLDCPVFRR